MDLSTYEGRQEARDQGYWVGDDGSGNIVAEYQGGSGGGGGGGGGGGDSGGGGGGSTYYQTVNGLQTLQTMEQQLRAVGWGGGEDVATAYARTTGGAVTPATGTSSTTSGTPGLPGTPGAGDFGAELQRLYEAMASGNADAIREQIRQFDLKFGLDKAGFEEGVRQYNQNFPMYLARETGIYQGAPTLAAQEQYARQFGQYGPPTQGQQTLEAQQQAWRQAFESGQLLGTYQGAPTLEALRQAGQFTGMYQGAPTLEALRQAGEFTGMYQGAPTLQAQEQYFRQAFDAERARQAAAQEYLRLVSSLRGPQDYGQLLKTMSATPQGISDLVRAAAGQYVPGVGTTGVQPQAVSLGGTINQVPGAQQTYADYMQQAQNLPAPNQIAPGTWNRLGQDQRQLLLGMYEQMGWTPQSVQDLYAQSLPKYALQQQQPAAAGTFRLV